VISIRSGSDQDFESYRSPEVGEQFKTPDQVLESNNTLIPAKQLLNNFKDKLLVKAVNKV